MKKIFILLAIICSGVLLTCSCSKNEDGNSGKGLDGDGVGALQVSGSVLCSGEGVANVVVTDGTNFTTTDAKGAYSLPLNVNAKLAYVSSPAGYTVEVKNSVPQYWTKTRGLKDKANVNFNLIKLNESDSHHFFVAVGDPQVSNAKEVALLVPIVNHMKSTIDALPTTIPVHLMIAGDMVFNKPLMNDASKACFATVDQPVYCAIGNHDHVYAAGDVTFDNDKTADSVFIRHYGPTYYSFNRGKVHYIVLDNIYFKGGKDAGYSVSFTPEQLSWVRRDLTYVSKDKAVVVMAHSPTISRKTASYGNSAELHALLKGYANIQIITGHTHYNSVYSDASSPITEHIVGAACGGFWEGPVCLDGAELGYKVFEVNGTEFKWEYISYLNPKDQFSVFVPEDRPAPLRPDEEFLVNVWDWDPNWTVEYSENGGLFKAMTRLTFTDENTYDPTAYTFFGITGDPHIPNRSFITAKPQDHMFKCVPAGSTTVINVRVVSSMGKEYVKSVDLTK